MTLNAGEAGHGNILTSGDPTPDRVAQARQLITGSGQQVLLGIDGGVTRENVGDVLGLGADIVVTGSAVFDGTAAAANARYMLGQAAAIRS